MHNSKFTYALLLVVFFPSPADTPSKVRQLLEVAIVEDDSRRVDLIFEGIRRALRQLYRECGCHVQQALHILKILHAHGASLHGVLLITLGFSTLDLAVQQG